MKALWFWIHEIKKNFQKNTFRIPIFIGINGDFAPWVGALIPDLNQAIIFIADKAKKKK